MDKNASRINLGVYIWSILLLLSEPNFVSGEMNPKSSMKTCSSAEASSDISMSSGFITAALATVGQVGFGTCDTDSNTCLDPLHVCPEETCCLPSAKEVKNCGCLEKQSIPQGVKSVCVDPKTFSFTGTGCSDNGADKNVSVQISFAHYGKDCVPFTKSELVVLDDGSIAVRIQHRSCAFKGLNKPEKIDIEPGNYANITVTVPVVGPVELKKLLKMLKNLNISKLADLFDIETLEKLLLHKKSLLSTNK